MDLTKIPLLSRVQPLPTAYGTNNVTNNTAELLARVLTYEFLPHDTPTIIIYDSTVVHIQHLALFGTSYTNRQRTRTVFPAISRMLAQRLEATNVRANPLPPPLNDEHRSLACVPSTLIDSVIAQIRKMSPCSKIWIPSKHLTLANDIVYIKIKSHQLRSNGHPKYHAAPQPCFALVYNNHLADKTCELPHTDHRTYPFPLRCTNSRFISLLYILPMNMYYGLYPVDTDLSDFTAITYNAEIILRLATKLEIEWHARNMSEPQSPNRIIGFMGLT